MDTHVHTRQAAWTLKMRALTQQVYVDEVEAAEESVAEMLDENAISQISRPGTSLKANADGQNSLSKAMRLHNLVFTSYI